MVVVTYSDDGTKGLIDAINCSPADPEPRLIYADWLEENGRDAEARGWRNCLQYSPGEMTSGWTFWDSKPSEVIKHIVSGESFVPKHLYSPFASGVTTCWSKSAFEALEILARQAARDL